MLKGKINWPLVRYAYIGWFFCGLSVFTMQLIFPDMMSSLAAYWLTLPFIYCYLTKAYYKKYPGEPPAFVGFVFLMLLFVTDLSLIRFFYGGVKWEGYFHAPAWGRFLLRSWIWPRFTTGTWIPFIIIPVTTYITGKALGKATTGS
ncbi:MAG: hypothetical protein ACE5GM_09545 [bacterium]